VRKEIRVGRKEQLANESLSFGQGKEVGLLPGELVLGSSSPRSRNHHR